jgi:hypothetical protein
MPVAFDHVYVITAVFVSNGTFTEFSRTAGIFRTLKDAKSVCAGAVQSVPRYNRVYVVEVKIDTLEFGHQGKVDENNALCVYDSKGQRLDEDDSPAA